jgi:hypothetical protein
MAIFAAYLPGIYVQELRVKNGKRPGFYTPCFRSTVMLDDSNILPNPVFQKKAEFPADGARRGQNQNQTE